MKAQSLSVAILIILFPLMAQSQFFNTGIRIGVNANKFNIINEGFLNGDPEIGFTGGVFMRFKTGCFSVQPEMLLSHKKGMFPYSMLNDGLDTFFHASFQNLDFPVIVNIHLGRHLRIGSGPVFSYGLGEKVSFTTTNSNYTIVINKDVFKEASYSWQFAGALELRHLFLEARYELGIDKLNYQIDLPGQSLSLNPSIYSRTWQFTVGYKLIARR